MSPQRNGALLFAVIVVIFAGLARAALAATALNTPTISNDTAFNDWNWTRDNWSGDDKPFVEARRTIDQQMSSAPEDESVVSSYENAAHANPGNALNQFEWVYAGYKLTHVPHKQPYNGLSGRWIASLANAKQPHTYNYTRLRFLLQGDNQQARELALRLLKRDPDDVAVEQVYCGILANSDSDADHNEALKLTRKFVANDQNVPTCYFELGFIYSRINEHHPDASVENNGIAAYTRFLALTRSYDWRRREAIALMGHLKQELAKTP